MNLIGNTYGRLTVIEKTNDRYMRHILWKCNCECGNETILSGHALKSGNTKSCGCWNTDHNAKPSGEAVINRIYKDYKAGALRRGKEFILSKEQVISIIFNNCFYCGNPPSTRFTEGGKKFHGEILYNGIDRLDNTIGYTLENSVPCCSKCNYAKRDMTYNEFISWAKRLNEGLIERDIRKALAGNTQFYVPSQIG